jgi:acyl-coenzyme A thioesterase PaaI-like protein
VTQAAPTPSNAAPGPEPRLGANEGGGEPVNVDAMTDDQAEAMVMRAPAEGKGVPAVALSFMERVEAAIARLSSRSPFWQRVCSMIWLPLAFRSGIQMKRVDEQTFQAVLPFKRFNRNWYNAMAGAALLANSEIAGGMYIMNLTGGDYTLVCKQLEYKFLRPCFGPAIYKIVPRDDLRTLIATGNEFNITIELDVIQQPLVPQALARLKKHDKLVARLASKERRVGRCVATFHLTPTHHQKTKRGSARKVG